MSQLADLPSHPEQTSNPDRTANPVFLALALLVGVVLLSGGCGRLGLGGESGSSDASPAATALPGDDEVAAVIDGKTITIGDVQQHMKTQFIEEFLRQPESQIYEMREKTIRDLVQRHVVEAEAEAREQTAESLYEEVTSAAPEPTLEDVTLWYSQNQGRLRGARLEDVAPQIQELLERESKSEAWAAFMQPRLEALSWEMVLRPPRVDLEVTRLVRGPAEAPITIMTFSDYQCPYCIRSEPVLAEVLSRYPTQVRVVHRHFPLDSIHPFARPAAEAAMCADEQGRFWDYHDASFARRGQLEEGAFAEIGAELELDLDALDSCIAERRHQAFVEADLAAGREAGVTGTPAFFVNGIALKGARDADELSRIVDTELARVQ